MTPEQYLDLIGDWQDPNHSPVIIPYTTGRGYNVWVVRDDFLGYGTKIRALDYLIGHSDEYKDKTEVVFGSCPATGYAQISLPYVTSKYGKKTTLFMAQRNMDNLHPFQKKGIELGANYVWVPNGMLAVTQKRARDYAAEDSTRAVLPLGLEHPTVTASFIRVARNLRFNPGTVWTVGSSGTLNRALQMAWPDAEVHVVQVGHEMSGTEIGRAIWHASPYKFNKSAAPSEMPPYPSVPEYDAKLWKVMLDYYHNISSDRKEPILIWNVA